MLELLTVGRRTVRRIMLAEDQDPSPQLDRIEELAGRLRVPVETVPRARLDAQARTEAPQGVLALARPLEPVALADLSRPDRHGTAPFLLVAAGITDPRNLGALLRSAECAGVTGVVLPRHRSARLSPTVAKTAAGAIEHLPFAVVGGVPAALSELRDLGVWSIGLAGRGGAVALRPAARRGARWPSWWAARRRGWRRWCAGAAMRSPPSPSTARCRRSTSAWPARWPASRSPASGRPPATAPDCAT